MNPFKKYLLILLSLSAFLSLQACESNDGEGAFEDAGEEIDEAGERVEEQVEEL